MSDQKEVRPTMADVAKLSGKTKMAVSRVMNGGSASEEMKKAVFSACEKLDFCCASCMKIGPLPVSLSESGESFYFCNRQCVMNFLTNEKTNG